MLYIPISNFFTHSAGPGSDLTGWKDEAYAEEQDLSVLASKEGIVEVVVE
jgi:hypothetical protein